MIIWLGFAGLVLIAAWPFWQEHRRRSMDDDARESAPGEFIALTDGITHFQWSGPEDGPVAVCVHGLTTPSFVWKGLVPTLTAMGYRVLTYDLFGRGYSDRPRGLQDEAFFLRQLDDLLASQKVEGDLTVLGYSMGGAIAACFTPRHPDRVRQLVLIAPAGLRLPRLGWRAKLGLQPGIGDWLMLMSYPAMHRKATEAERGLPSTVPGIVDLQQAELEFRGFAPAVLSSFRGMLSSPVHAAHEEVARQGIPVLAILGRVDRLIPPEVADVLAARNAEAQVEVIDGAGHGLTYTHSAEISGYLRAFLSLAKRD